MTRRLLIDPNQPDPTLLAEAAAILRHGGLVAFPTETVYGLGANALDPAAVERIFRAKERARDDPLIVHLASADDLLLVAEPPPPLAQHIAARFWPGPLTLVLPRRATVPPIVTAGRPTVGVRVPSHPVARGLLQAAHLPVAAPSANRFTRTSATRAEHVLDDLAGRVELILDAGPTPVGIESTVVAIEGDQVRILRPGAIPPEAIAEAIAPFGGTLAFGSRHPSEAPGQAPRHYAPRAALTVFRGPPERAVAAALAQAQQELAAGRRVGALLAAEDAPEAEQLGIVVERLGAREDLASIAHALFAALRRLDQTGVEVIVAPTFGEEGLGLALLDRLTRAAEGRVVRV
ncbi:MAG: threonylcarbamoyl-AMP synthase [Dehalococcoidia bacterium]|nr:MAG: threonylcarbamoyl-AMP synthase [Dehalococcoidia bacterium]